MIGWFLFKLWFRLVLLTTPASLVTSDIKIPCTTQDQSGMNWIPHAITVYRRTYHYNLDEGAYVKWKHKNSTKCLLRSGLSRKEASTIPHIQQNYHSAGSRCLRNVVRWKVLTILRFKCSGWSLLVPPRGYSIFYTPFYKSVGEKKLQKILLSFYQWC